MSSQSMTAQELRVALSLASIFSLRMMGLFMVLPVFSLHAVRLDQATPMLVGLAVGVYGLTQALFQIPFGMLSDRYGRKPMIILGLVIFALGSVVAAYADSIYGIIVGRALQGSGAISAAVMALASDLTREEHRTKVMAVLGMSIGLSFAFSLVMGPLLDAWIGIGGIFWLTAALALLGIVLVKFVVPDPGHSIVHRDTESVPRYFSDVLHNGQLLRVDFGIFVLHLILTATFVTLPFAMRDLALATNDYWKLYLPALLVGIIAMVPLVVIAEKRRKIKGVYLLGILGIIAAEAALMALHATMIGLLFALLIFFLAFNLLEALLPSLVAKFAPPDKKGTAMGVYSTLQFVGAFCGGIIGGALYHDVGYWSVFLVCALAAALWWLWARSMQAPRHLSNHMLHLGAMPAGLWPQVESELRAVRGVAEVVMVPDEGAAYLKIDSGNTDMEQLAQITIQYQQDAPAGA